MLEPIVSRKKNMLRNWFFLSLSNASDVSLAFYSEKSRANLKIVKISQQMLKFQKDLNVQTRTLFLRIFIFSVISIIKISLILHY